MPRFYATIGTSTGKGETMTREDQLDKALREAREFQAEKTKWFPVEDSELKNQDGEGTGVFNIDARFADHPILNVSKSRIARHNVYDLGPSLHMRILNNADGDPVQVKNGTTHVMRFDKGEDKRVASHVAGPGGNMLLHYEGPEGMGKEDFEAAVRDIIRCWPAWVHYQKFREAPVTLMEEKALAIIAAKPLVSGGKIMVDVGGTLQARQIEADEGEEDEQGPARPAPRGRRGKKAA
jgi:hypothetical protein